VRGGSKESLRGVDFAVTQPGTNTLELMHCSVPFLVAVPFSSLRHIPLPGIAGALAKIPLFGPALREAALKSKGRRTGFLAWPNRLAGREVIDEMIGEISAGDVAGRVEKRLLDEEYLARTKKSLAALSSSAPRNAAAFMADHIERMLAER
jgi:lipid-A-disaccharide synthase